MKAIFLLIFIISVHSYTLHFITHSHIDEGLLLILLSFLDG